jgi:hypothetical protein
MGRAVALLIDMDADDAEKVKGQKVQRLLYGIMAVFILAPLIAAYLLR